MKLGSFVYQYLATAVLSLLFGAKAAPQESLNAESPMPKESRARPPLGMVSLLDSSVNQASLIHVPIRDFGAIYSSIGVSRERFKNWENEYGMDSLGLGQGGELLAPGYPIFSKVAWMYIEPVDLSVGETQQLAFECENAISMAENSSIRDEIARIRELAQMALIRKVGVRFGHP